MYATHQDSEETVGNQNNSLGDDVDWAQLKGQHRQMASLGINGDMILPNVEKKQVLNHKYDTRLVAHKHVLCILDKYTLHQI